MNRLFLRIYGAVLIALLVLWAINLAIFQFAQRPDFDRRIETFMQPTARWLVDRMVEAREQGNSFESALPTEDVIPFKVHIRSMSEANLLTEDSKLRLAETGISAKGTWTHRMVHVLIPDSDKVIEIGPVGVMKGPVDWRLIVTGFFAFLGIGLGIYLVLRPVKRDLVELSDAAEAFGQGNFERRAIVDGPGSVKHLAYSFNSMAERTSNLIDSHKALLRAASHELRTPLARIVMSIDSLAEADDDDEREQLLGGVEESLGELEALIEELLDFTKLQEGAPISEKEPCEISDVLEAALDAFTPHVGELKVEVKLPEDSVSVLAAPRFLRRVLDNLLSNASRYAKTQVALRCVATEDRIQIMVDDDGPGVPEDKRHDVFRPFVRLDASRNRHSGGFGLGLSIADRITRQHDGMLSVHKSPEGGARFMLDMPRLIEEPELEPPLQAI
jgi:two-component system, OmpR family, sensor histidine kinase RstB